MTSDEMIDALHGVPAGTSADVSGSMATFADSDEGAELSTFSGKVRDLRHGHGPVDGAYSLRLQDERGSVTLHPPLFTGGTATPDHIELHHGVIVTRIALAAV